MKTVKITRDSVAKIIDFPQDYKAMQQEIGADLVERVKTRRMIKHLGSDVSFLCDEDFWRKYGHSDSREAAKHLNAPASTLYDGVILGDVFFVKEEGENWRGFDSIELMELVLALKDFFGEYLEWEDNENE